MEQAAIILEHRHIAPQIREMPMNPILVFIIHNALK